MNTVIQYLLKEQRLRNTRFRQAILQTLDHQASPISAPDLLRKLQISGYSINKTTVYREMDILLAKGLVEEVRFNEDVRRYELKSAHHHHLICQTCQKIEEIAFAHDLSDKEAEILATKKFKVLKHSLEFFGLCESCQKKCK
ncbi:transcriptional repressor [Patescibacteria group bacterium]|nr:transcriptional repressor [Patescibacteria group bacterium]